MFHPSHTFLSAVNSGCSKGPLLVENINEPVFPTRNNTIKSGYCLMYDDYIHLHLHLQARLRKFLAHLFIPSDSVNRGNVSNAF